jgi:hypothetical protein
VRNKRGGKSAGAERSKRTVLVSVEYIKRYVDGPLTRRPWWPQVGLRGGAAVAAAKKESRRENPTGVKAYRSGSYLFEGVATPGGGFKTKPPNMEDQHILDVVHTCLFFSSNSPIIAPRAFIRSVALEHLVR